MGIGLMRRWGLLTDLVAVDLPIRDPHWFGLSGEPGGPLMGASGELIPDKHPKKISLGQVRQPRDGHGWTSKRPAGHTRPAARRRQEQSQQAPPPQLPKCDGRAGGQPTIARDSEDAVDQPGAACWRRSACFPGPG